MCHILLCPLAVWFLLFGEIGAVLETSLRSSINFARVALIGGEAAAGERGSFQNFVFSFLGRNLREEDEIWRMNDAGAS